jgi:hypothetical protein
LAEELWVVPCGSHPSVPGLLTFFFSAIGVIGVHPFRQVTDLPNAARRPQRDGAKHRSNWCKGSGKWIKGVSNLCLIHFILCTLSSDTLLVHIYSSPRSTMHILSSPFFPHIFCCKLQFISLFRGG